MQTKSEAPTPDAGAIEFDEKQILEEARKRYAIASEADDENRKRYNEQLAFVAGDQWDAQLKAFRESRRRPCLVMDRLGTHINQAVNDLRQNKPAIKTHPAGGKANVDAAEVIDGVIRNIEYCSNASSIYIAAAYTQIAAGQGAWRVLTKYVDEESFEQDIYLERILDPTSLLLDPSRLDPVGSDAEWGFVETSLPMAAFKEQYPNVKVEDWPTKADDKQWWSDERVRLVEYYRIKKVPTKIHLMPDGSTADDARLAKLNEGSTIPVMPVSSRPSYRRQVQWFKLGGHSVIDSRVVPGKWIPLIKIIGNEINLRGKRIYTGMTWRAMDAARMYNYQASVVVEMLSLQKSAPWIGAKGAFAGVEQQWRAAATDNPAYLEYEPILINDQLAPPPRREAPPTVPTGNVQAMELAALDLQWVTGQHAANFGAKSNETSGRAIIARQSEGDTATFHYQDHQALGIVYTGKIIVDMIPEVYDTARILRMMGEDGTSEAVEHDPAATAAMTKTTGANGKVRKVYNLGLGRYDVTVNVGPNYGTKRIEAVEAMTAILGKSPELMQAIGDLYFGAQDWPGAQEMAKRLKKMVPPNLQDLEGMDETEQLRQQAGEMQQALEQADLMMQQRDQALQMAAEQVQKMQDQIQQLQQENARSTTDVAAKTRAAEVAAEAEVRVAEINASVEAMKAMQEALRADVEQLRALVIKVNEAELAEAEEREGAGEEPDEASDAAQASALLQRIAEGQAQLQEAASLMLASMNRPKTISVERDENGQVVGARSE